MCPSNQLYDTVDNNLIAYGVHLTDLSSISQNAEVTQSVVETDDTIGSAEATRSADTNIAGATGKAETGSGDVNGTIDDAVTADATGTADTTGTADATGTAEPDGVCRLRDCGFNCATKNVEGRSANGHDNTECWDKNGDIDNSIVAKDNLDRTVGCFKST